MWVIWTLRVINCFHAIVCFSTTVKGSPSSIRRLMVYRLPVLFVNQSPVMQALCLLLSPGSMPCIESLVLYCNNISVWQNDLSQGNISVSRDLYFHFHTEMNVLYNNNLYQKVLLYSQN